MSNKEKTKTAYEPHVGGQEIKFIVGNSNLIWK